MTDDRCRMVHEDRARAPSRTGEGAVGHQACRHQSLVLLYTHMHSAVMITIVLESVNFITLNLSPSSAQQNLLPSAHQPLQSLVSLVRIHPLLPVSLSATSWRSAESVHEHVTAFVDRPSRDLSPRPAYTHVISMWIVVFCLNPKASSTTPWRHLPPPAPFPLSPPPPLVTQRSLRSSIHKF